MSARAEAALAAVRTELDRIAALRAVNRDETSPDRFSVGARWTIRLIRDALGEQPFEAPAEMVDDDGTPPPAGEPTQPAPQDFVIWSATFPDDDSTFGHYTSRDPAMAHIHQLLADEENTTTEEIQTRVLWRPDDPTGPEGAPSIWECWFIEADRDDYEATGYVVSPLTVAAAYEPTPQADRFPYLGTGPRAAVAYRSPDTGFIYCRLCFTEGGVFPGVTSEELPHGGICACCGIDVLIDPQQSGSGEAL